MLNSIFAFSYQIPNICVICTMKNFSIIVVATFTLWSCKDEFNLPQYSSYIDRTNPTITLVSPTENDTLSGSTEIILNYKLKDDYKLKSFTIRIIPEDINLPEYIDSIALTDSAYNYFKQYTLPTETAMRYEVNLALEDSASWGTNKVYFFNYK